MLIALLFSLKLSVIHLFVVVFPTIIELRFLKKPATKAECGRYVTEIAMKTQQLSIYTTGMLKVFHQVLGRHLNQWHLLPSVLEQKPVLFLPGNDRRKAVANGDHGVQAADSFLRVIVRVIRIVQHTTRLIIGVVAVRSRTLATEASSVRPSVEIDSLAASI